MSLTKVTYSMISGAAANVKDFGAVGDGVTDDTLAIQRAVSSGARDVYFPSGSYNISSQITCVSNQRFFGNATINLYESNSAFFFNVSNTSNVSFDGLTFNGRRSTWTYNFIAGSTPTENSRSRYAPIFGTGASNIQISNCTFYDLYSSAIYLFGNLVNEQAQYTGVKILNCSCTNSNFELATILLYGDILISGCYTKNNRNTSGNFGLVGNGTILTACNDIRVENNYFGPSDGTGCKLESVNGAAVINGNTFELNDFNSINLQESAFERPDVANHNEKVVISGNTCIRPGSYCVSAESGTDASVWNVTITGNVFISPVLGGVVLSGNNCVVSGNTFSGASVTRGGTPINAYGVLINQSNGNTIENIVVSSNVFNKNTASVSGRSEIQFGLADPPNFVLRNVSITGNTIYNPIFRSVFSVNNVNATNVLVSENLFYKTVLDGTATSDIYVFNDTDILRWTVCNNTASQNIAINLIKTGSYSAVFNNRITATESKDPTNQYVVAVNGALANIFDLGRRLVGRATAAPTTGTYEVGDLIWNSAPVAGGTMGWVCTTGGTPGTWKTFGAISA